MPRATLFEKVGYGGRYEETSVNAPCLPQPLDGRAAAATTDYESGWTVFWASRDYDEDEDSLWVEGARGANDPNLSNLFTVPRAHGNNHWGNRIRAVSFSSSGPSGSNKNRTIYFKSGRLVCGVSRKHLETTSASASAER